MSRSGRNAYLNENVCGLADRVLITIDSFVVYTTITNIKGQTMKTIPTVSTEAELVYADKKAEILFENKIKNSPLWEKDFNQEPFLRDTYTLKNRKMRFVAGKESRSTTNGGFEFEWLHMYIIKL